MAIAKSSNSSRSFNDVHGVRVLHASQVDTLLNEDMFVEKHSRDIGSTGTELFYRKDDLPVWKLLWDSATSLKTFNCRHCGDRHFLESVANVITSLPFIAIGLQVPRKKMAAKFFGDSLVGVGVVSSLYHMSRGQARQAFRFGDYAMIAVATLCLSSAIKEDNPKALTLASILVIPVQPTVVSAVHTGIMEVSFLQRATNEPKLRAAYNLHKLSTIIGGALFVADDIMPHTPYLHAAWHLAAAFSVATCSHLLE